MTRTPLKALLFGVALAAAQPPVSDIVFGQSPVAPQDQLSMSKLNLTMEQRHVIKELIKEQKVTGTAGNVDLTVGATVPGSIQLRPMPADVSARAPQIKSHLYFLKDEQIVLVDPKDNRIVEVIE